MASDPFLDFCDQLKEMSSASTDEWSFFSPAPVEPAQVNEPQNPEYSPAVPNLDIISGITEDLRFPKSQGVCCISDSTCVTSDIRYRSYRLLAPGVGVQR